MVFYMYPLCIEANSTRRYLQSAKGLFKAEVYVTTLANGRKVVCKDYSRFQHRPLARWLVSYLVKREYRVLERLNDWQYSPKVYASHDPLVLVQEYINGRLISRFATGSEEVVGQLQMALQQLHQQGVAHNDIHADNVIVRADNQPVLIDFTSATWLPKWPVINWLQHKLYTFDQRHLVKIKQRLGNELSLAEQQQLKRPQWLEFILKVWKQKILPFLKLLHKSS